MRRGFAHILIIILVLVVVGIAAVMFLGPRRKFSDSTPSAPLVTYNLGINFDDFELTDIDLTEYNNKIFLEYGETLVTNRGSFTFPHPYYILPPGTKIIAVTDGTVKEIRYQEHTDDYSLVINTPSGWTIDHDHVGNTKVKKGDKVSAGQVIAEVKKSNGYIGQFDLGFTEIMIFADSGPSENPLTACLYNLLDESVKSSLHAQIYDFAAKWEEFRGDKNIYDEDSWESPGCIVNEMVDPG